MLYRLLPRNMLIINVEKSIEEHVRPSNLYRIISIHNSNADKVELVKWRPSQISSATTVVSIKSRSDFSVLSSTRKDLSQTHKLVVMSPYPPLPGLKDLVKEWRKETDRNQIYLILVSESEHLDQLPELDLAYNVLNKVSLLLCVLLMLDIHSIRTTCSCENNYCYSKGVWGGEYFSSWQEKLSIQRGITLRSGLIGDLDSLQWVENAEPTGPGISVKVSN